VEFNHIELGRRQQGLGGGHFQHRRMIGVKLARKLLQSFQLTDIGVLLEEQLGANAFRRAQQRHGTAPGVLQHQIGDQGVIAHHVDLLHAAGRVDQPVRIGDLE